MPPTCATVPHGWPASFEGSGSMACVSAIPAGIRSSTATGSRRRAADSADLRPLRRPAVRSGPRVVLAAIRAGRPRRSAVRTRGCRRQGTDVRPRQGDRIVAVHARRSTGEREVPVRGRGGDRQPHLSRFPGSAPTISAHDAAVVSDMRMRGPGAPSLKSPFAVRSASS